MRDGKVELLAEGRPCATIGDDSFLEGGIRVEHWLAVDLVHTGVDMAAELGEDGALEVFVFEIECVPRMDRFRGAYVLPHGVGVIFDLGEGIEVWVLVGRAFVRRRQWHGSFPHLYLAIHRQGANAEKNPEQQGRPHSFSSVPPNFSILPLAVCRFGGRPGAHKEFAAFVRVDYPVLTAFRPSYALPDISCN